MGEAYLYTSSILSFCNATSCCSMISMGDVSGVNLNRNEDPDDPDPEVPANASQ